MSAPNPIPVFAACLTPRFWSKVEITDGCWNWLAATTRAGYGRYRLASPLRHVLAHRFLFTAIAGDPGDRLVCHTCDNPRCVNPKHLFLGTHSDNARDMQAKGRAPTPWQLRKTHCPQGHAYTPTNTWRPAGRNARYCRTCKNVRAREWRRAA